MRVKELYKQQIQIGDNVTDIMRLPCVIGVRKVWPLKAPMYYRYSLRIDDANTRQHAYKGEWLCERYDGSWIVKPEKEVSHD